LRATRLLRAALELPSETVLDCAVGTGKHAIAFLSKGKKVTGLDIFDPKLRHENYTAKGQTFEKADLPEFDLVWSCHTLEHVENPGFFLRRLRDWTKPGGWLAGPHQIELP
jgi:2-polyprenyl-3-methyl-5-hydroxy-6-metoxy-1,4-benzoquinol methylase